MGIFDIEEFEKPLENIENSVNNITVSTEFPIWITDKRNQVKSVIHSQTPHKSALNIDVKRGYSKPSIMRYVFEVSLNNFLQYD